MDPLLNLQDWHVVVGEGRALFELDSDLGQWRWPLMVDAQDIRLFANSARIG